MITYFAFNIAVLFCFFMLKPLFDLLSKHRCISFATNLNLNRSILLVLILLFACLPFIPHNSMYHNNLLVPPNVLITIIPHATIESHKANVDIIIPFFLLLGIIGNTTQFVKSFLNLKSIKASSTKLRQINAISIYICNSSHIAFCSGFLFHAMIFVPQAYIDKPETFKLSISHELQHLRQYDILWLYIFSVIRIVCFWNPILILWIRWCIELQEYACDEAIILNKNNSLSAYARCLINAAKFSLAGSALAMNDGTKSNLYRRVNMLFKYKPIRNKILNSLLYVFSVCCVITSAYATHLTQPLTVNEIKKLIQPSFASTMHITAEPELVNRLNHILTNETAYSSMQAALGRMQNYKNTIQSELNSRNLPNDLFAMPIVQSGFKPLPESANRVKAAGIWQIIPSTAERLGLTVTAKQDDRLNTSLSTKAALDYLQTLYKEFKDWKLAVVAYDLGEKKTEELIKKTGSRNAWVIARSSDLPEQRRQELLNYLAHFDATVIILHNKSLISS